MRVSLPEYIETFFLLLSFSPVISQTVLYKELLKERCFAFFQPAWKNLSVLRQRQFLLSTVSDSTESESCSLNSFLIVFLIFAIDVMCEQKL